VNKIFALDIGSALAPNKTFIDVAIEDLLVDLLLHSSVAEILGSAWPQFQKQVG
jgi:hypothetical protein